MKRMTIAVNDQLKIACSQIIGAARKSCQNLSLDVRPMQILGRIGRLVNLTLQPFRSEA
jgi:hypothetical protein